MIFLIWMLPALIVVAALASGRIATLKAAALGMAAALTVALAAAPRDISLTDAGHFIARGAWIGWIVVPYILGGLLFWQMAIRRDDAAGPVVMPMDDGRARRRLLFTACLLIGPFAESATGFGIGMIGTMLLIRRLKLASVYLLGFCLLSQTMIPWGGMGSGAIIAAAFARADATTLAVHTGYFNAVLNCLWLPLYWSMADKAGIGAGWAERFSEVRWLGAGQALAIAATALLGPEIALLAAYGPLIVLRYLIDARPGRAELWRMTIRIAPFAILIGWLTATRLLPPLTDLLQQVSRIAPFDHAPIWFPLFHAGTWLVIGAVITCLLRGHGSALAGEMRAAWTTGRLAVLSIIMFSMMAELLSGSGIADGLARGLYAALGRWAIVLTPMISAIFAALANSGNAANGMFMASQVSLAHEAGLNVAAVAALQQVAGLSLTMLSPVRMAIVCSLAGTPGRERDAYRQMLPFALAAIALLLVSSMLIAANRI